MQFQFDKTIEKVIVVNVLIVHYREQINASRRRNPNRQVSRSMRNLTVGDAVYENEFVTLPPKTKRPNRKRKLVSAYLTPSLKKTKSSNSLNYFSQ